MKAKIEINMDNAAFEDSGELSAILVKLAKLVEPINNQNDVGPYDSNITLKDSNGNTVGLFRIVNNTI